MTKRSTTPYALKFGNEIVQFGITDQELIARLSQHISDGKQATHICPIGGKMTRKNALKVEAKNIKRYQLQHGGKPPRYNIYNTY